MSGSHLPFRTSSPLHSFPAAPLFCRHASVQKIILPVVSALSLNRLHYVEPTPCFCHSTSVSSFKSSFRNLSLFINLFFSPIALIYDCMYCPDIYNRNGWLGVKHQVSSMCMCVVCTEFRKYVHLKNVLAHRACAGWHFKYPLLLL